MSLKSIKQTLIVTLVSCMVTGVFAEEAAPVYDVDNYPPQFDGASDTGASGVPSSSSELQSTEPPEPDLQPQIQTRAHPESATVETNSAPPPTALTLEQRMRRVEQQINNAQQLTNSPKVDALQNQVQSLRGQVEELTHQLQQMQNQQRALSTDIDKRLRQLPANEVNSASTLNTPDTLDKSLKIESSITKPATTLAKAEPTSPSTEPLKPTATVDQPNVAEEQQIYQTAYDLIKAKKYNDAIAALQKMLQKYPTGQFAANAHYWLGELYGLLNKNDLSAQEFSTVVKVFPNSPKVADAQLKVGLIYAGQFKWKEAKTSFKKIINQYPGTSSARLAAEQLKQMKLAGH